LLQRNPGLHHYLHWQQLVFFCNHPWFVPITLHLLWLGRQQ
jgi:hypothetical protein